MVEEAKTRFRIFEGRDCYDGAILVKLSISLQEQVQWNIYMFNPHDPYVPYELYFTCTSSSDTLLMEIRPFHDFEHDVKSSFVSIRSPPFDHEISLQKMNFLGHVSMTTFALLSELEDALYNTERDIAQDRNYMLVRKAWRV